MTAQHHPSLLQQKVQWGKPSKRQPVCDHDLCSTISNVSKFFIKGERAPRITHESPAFCLCWPPDEQQQWQAKSAHAWVKYLVQNPFSLKVPKGTATLCLGNSRLMMAGRLQHWELSAPGTGEKPSNICFWRMVVSSTDGPTSGMMSQQGSELDFTSGCSPPGQMLKVALSGTWRCWKDNTEEHVHYSSTEKHLF